VFEFTRFSNVWDVTKLNKVLNSIYFGEFWIVVNVARFDRFKDNVALIKGIDEGEKISIEDGKQSRDKEMGEVVVYGRRKGELVRVNEEAVRREREDGDCKVGREVQLNGGKKKRVNGKRSFFVEYFVSKAKKEGVSGVESVE